LPERSPLSGPRLPKIEEITMAEKIKPTINSILDLQALDADLNRSEEGSLQTWTCVSYASKLDER
jgi:hypothetical protein